MSEMENALEILKSRIGAEQPVGDWVEMTQEMVNKFADATGDHQWIHVDVERAKKGPFGAPIAHGQLTLSILGILGRREAPTDVQQRPRHGPLLAGRSACDLHPERTGRHACVPRGDRRLGQPRASERGAQW